MIYKNFRINLIIRVFLLIISIFLFYLSFQTNFFFTPIIVGILIIIQVVSLIRYIDKTNRELTSFLESIRFSEFTRRFNMESMGSSFRPLNKAFNDVINDFQQVRQEKEQQYHFLQTILQNIDISVLAYQSDGTIDLINKAAKKLFQVAGLTNIRALEKLSPELVQVLFTIKPGESQLVKVFDEDDYLQLSVNASSIKIHDNTITLATIKDIQHVLEEQETEAWQKLIRVLTHEIMNSITPIASLSATLETMLESLPGDQQKGRNLTTDTLSEIENALKTINKRSNGLLHFVDTYRNLTRIPKPNFTFIKVKNLFSALHSLFGEELTRKGIKFTTEIEPEELEITADEQLIEQVMINLIKNSMHALSENKSGMMKLVGFYNKRGRITLQVVDNGQGILPDVIEKIFIPFFTTKPTGSGIGLSLSRQIMRMHNGTITVHSDPGQETTFTLTF